MTDITELAQRNELLIANGQQTADLLRHLADNEIDSDYFAVVSECESYGKETDAELSITEFALRAAGYVDALVEALEKAHQVDEELCKLLPPGAEYMDPPDGGDVTPLEGVRRMVADYRQRIAELESRTVKLPSLNPEMFNEDVMFGYRKAQKEAVDFCAAAGIKVEAE
ncbi:hypothetical protein [Klebsiella pneumoniae]|uniref:hypothetical protein n=1 Tax=Klebsiella pneumoniae TaxID=573 RepID=UPI0028BD8105|nr:hypothetical protein [Klebsiella pneumoniae]